MPLAGDSWDSEPLPLAPPRDVPGRRRRHPPGLRLAIPLAIAALLGVAAAWLIPATRGVGAQSNPEKPGAEPLSMGATGAEPTPVASDRAPVRTTTTAGPPSSSTGPRAGNDGSGGPAGPTSEPQLPVAYEAEAGPPTVRLRGTAEVAEVAGASGGRVVRRLGEAEDGSGSLQVRVDLAITGSYHIELSYVPDSVARTGTITVAGSGTVAVAFAAGSGCCAVTTVDVTIQSGARTMTVGGPSGPMPAIDKIVISPA